MLSETAEKGRSHVRERLRERYGLEIRPQILAEIIDRGGATFVAHGAEGSGRLIYAVPIGGKLVNCLYLPRPGFRGYVVSVLPAELVKEKQTAQIQRRNEQHETSLRSKRATAKQFFRDLRNSEDEDDF